MKRPRGRPRKDSTRPAVGSTPAPRAIEPTAGDVATPEESPPAPAEAPPTAPTAPVAVFSEVPEHAGTTPAATEAPPPPIFTAPPPGTGGNPADEFTAEELPPEVAQVVTEVAAAQEPEPEPVPPSKPDPDSPVAGLMMMLNVVAIDYIGRTILGRDPPPPTESDIREGKAAWAPYAAKVQDSLGLNSDGARLALFELKYGMPRTLLAPRKPAATPPPDDAPPPEPRKVTPADAPAPRVPRKPAAGGDDNAPEGTDPSLMR